VVFCGRGPTLAGRARPLCTWTYSADN